MQVPTVTVPLSTPVHVAFNLATLIRVEKRTGKTPVALVNDIAAGVKLPYTVHPDNAAEWLATDEGKAASAAAAARISPTAVVEFVSTCANVPADQVAEELPLYSAYEVYTQLQSGLVDATKQLLSAKADADVASPPPSAG